VFAAAARSCKVAVDAPLLAAVAEACERGGQWARAEALRASAGHGSRET